MGLTIACVFNDIAVRKHCLDRSLAAYTGPVEIEYLPVDNTGHIFTSAGAALNHAARLAYHEVVVMVHQDVYLHDVDQLAAAARGLEDPRWGLLGANGVTARRQSAGRLRDRVILIGQPAPRPVEVDTLDEVLVMARREDLLTEPLTEVILDAFVVATASRAPRPWRRLPARNEMLGFPFASLRGKALANAGSAPVLLNA